MIQLNTSNAPTRIDRDVVSMIPTPRATRSWCPTPHIDLLDAVERRLDVIGAEIVGSNYTIRHHGARFFATLQIENGDTPNGWRPTVGIRNTHDMSAAAGIACGLQVLVCSNMSFCGDMVLSRKHTRFVNRDLPDLVDDCLGHVQFLWHRQEQQVESYRNTSLTDPQAHDLMIRGLDAGVLPSSKIQDVVSEWREPSHEAFTDRSLWSWFNAVTETLK